MGRHWGRSGWIWNWSIHLLSLFMLSARRWKLSISMLRQAGWKTPCRAFWDSFWRRMVQEHSYDNVVFCDVCQFWLRDGEVANSHYRGKMHRKKMAKRHKKNQLVRSEPKAEDISVIPELLSRLWACVHYSNLPDRKICMHAHLCADPVRCDATNFRSLN